ncbi:MAG: hypothetical protein HUU38_13100 [Anaerolineales bacterium]|nr:hypothetical protein [Anaerolineales bacterium]
MFQKFHNLFNEFKTLYVAPQQYTGREMLSQLGIRTGMPVIVFKEGDNYLADERLERTVCEGIARAAAEIRATLVDHGANVGLMGFLNTAVRERHHSGLYIGVAPRGLTRLPNQTTYDHLIALGDAHTHFVLVEGDRWGIEMPTLNAMLKALADTASFLVVSIKGNPSAETEGKIGSDNPQKTMTAEMRKSMADSISLQLRFPGHPENAAPPKLSREEIFPVADLYAEPEKLTNKIKYYLKIYGANG